MELEIVWHYLLAFMGASGSFLAILQFVVPRLIKLIAKTIQEIMAQRSRILELEIAKDIERRKHHEEAISKLSDIIRVHTNAITSLQRDTTELKDEMKTLTTELAHHDDNLAQVISMQKDLGHVIAMKDSINKAAAVYDVLEAKKILKPTPLPPVEKFPEQKNVQIGPDAYIRKSVKPENKE